MSAWRPRVEVRDGRIVWSHTGAPLSATHPLPATSPGVTDVDTARTRREHGANKKRTRREQEENTAPSPPATQHERPWWVPTPSVTRHPQPRRPPDRGALDVPSGDVLRARREALGLSERELAVVVGCSRSILHDLEVGNRRAAPTARKVLATLNRLQAGQQEPSA